MGRRRRSASASGRSAAAAALSSSSFCRRGSHERLPLRDLAHAGVFFIAIVGLNLLTGYTGQISLGHGA